MRLRTSCDACSARKTRCDLGNRQDGTCSYCENAGLSCSVSTLANPRRAPSSKRGPTANVARRSRSWSRGPQSAATHRHLYNRQDSVTTVEQNAPRLLGVFGLSRKALIACLEGFFEYPGAWFQLPDDRAVFLHRTKLMLAMVTGEDVDDPESDTFEKAAEATTSRGSPFAQFRIDSMSQAPAHETLVLAVAARGSLYTAYKHLQQNIVERIGVLLQESQQLSAGDLDIMMAIAVVSELIISPLHPLMAKSRVLKGEADTSPTQNDMLRLDPLGKGFLSELCISTGLNIAVPDSHPLCFRRAYVFWIIHSNDAIRSTSAEQMYRLSNDDVGWPIPPGTPSEIPFIHFAKLARRLCRAFFSARAKLHPISNVEKERLIEAFVEFPQFVSLPMEFVTECSSVNDSEDSGLTSTTPAQASGSSRGRHQRIKDAVLFCLWLRLSLCLWIQLERTDAKAMRDTDDSDDSLTAMIDTFGDQAATQMCILASRCSPLGFIEGAPAIFVSAMCGWCLYSIQLMSRIRSRSSATASSMQRMTAKRSLEKHHQHGLTLINTIRAVRAVPNAEQIADSLMRRLQDDWNASTFTQISRAAGLSASLSDPNESHGAEVGGEAGDSNRPNGQGAHKKKRRINDHRLRHMAVDGQFLASENNTAASSRELLSSHDNHDMLFQNPQTLPSYLASSATSPVNNASTGAHSIDIMYPSNTVTPSTTSAFAEENSMLGQSRPSYDDGSNQWVLTWDSDLLQLFLASGIELPSGQ